MNLTNSDINKSFNKYIISQNNASGIQLYHHARALNKLMEKITTKKMKISVYLISHVSPKTNIFSFTVKDLAKQFGTSKATVRNAIKLLKSDKKHLIVTNKFIRYRNYYPNKLNYIKKGGNKHAEL